MFRTHALAAAASLLLLEASATGQEYVFQDLGIVGPHDINDEGYIVGDGLAGQAVMIRPDNTMVFLPSHPNSNYGRAFAINDARVIAGESGYRAIIWPTPAAFVELPSLPGAAGNWGAGSWGINQRGQVAGQTP